MSQIKLKDLPPIAEIGNECFLTQTFCCQPDTDRVSSLSVRKMTAKLEPWTNLSHLLRTSTGIILTKNGDRFYQTNFIAEDVQAHDPHSFGNDWTNRIPNYIMRLKGMSFEQHLKLKQMFPKDARFYWGYQPLHIELYDNLRLFLYMPFGTLSNLQLVVLENDTVLKKFEVQLRTPDDSFEFTSNWEVYYDKTSLDGQSLPFETSLPLTLFNVVRKEGRIHLYKCSFDFNWPRLSTTQCYHCFKATSGSQLCGGGSCIVASTYPQDLKKMRNRHKAENMEHESYHLSYKKIEVEDLCPDNFPENKVHVEYCRPSRDELIVRVGKHLFEASFIVGQFDSFYESDLAREHNIVSYSPFLSTKGYFHYLTDMGDLIVFGTLMEKERRTIINFVPKAALETTKLFLVQGMLLCYYVLEEDHFLVNLNLSLIEDL
jgi:hypothetical protein